MYVGLLNAFIYTHKTTSANSRSFAITYPTYTYIQTYNKRDKIAYLIESSSLLHDACCRLSTGKVLSIAFGSSFRLRVSNLPT